VLDDNTTGTRWLGHLARMLVQLTLLIALIAVLLPASLPLRLACALAEVIPALIFSLAYISETTDDGVINAGYPAGTALAAGDHVEVRRAPKAV
jgi:Family of unknown function (DUF5313)